MDEIIDNLDVETTAFFCYTPLMSNNIQDESEKDFAAYFEESFTDIGRLHPGQSVETEIVSISGDTIFLQLGGKSEGVLNSAELIDKDGNLTVQEGETIKVYFLAAKNGEMQFTTRIGGENAGTAMLENAFESRIPVEGAVTKEIKGGFEVMLGDSRSFCPYSQMGLKRVENGADFVGKTLTFRITEYGEKGRNILVSNRAILEEEHQKEVESLKKTLREDMVVTGTVKLVQDFGAFVDLGGVQALLPISEISRSRIEDIHQVIKKGDEVEAAIIKLDWPRERITLSKKALLGDPWDEATEKYPVGSRHEGKVVRLTNFGAFVNLEPGLDGLIHVSDLKTEDRETNPADVLKQGETVSVVINKIDPERKRISLRTAASVEQDAETQRYMDAETDSDTYNPFAALLKDRNKKEKK